MNRKAKSLLILLLALVSFSCKKNLESSYFSVDKISGGNSLILRNGITVRLIGINPSPASSDYLQKNVLNKDVKLVFNTSKKREKAKNQSEYWAYVILKDGRCINSEILQDGLSTLNTNYLVDSLDRYRAYSGGNDKISTPPAAEQAPIENGRVYSPSEIYKMYENSIVVVYSGSAMGGQKLGTGFFVNENTAITNHHVIEGGSEIVVKMKTGKLYNVKRVVAKSKEYDYAVLEVDISPGVNPIPVNVAPPTIGEDVVIIGNPQGLEFTITKGIVSAIRDQEGTSQAIIQFDAAISKGNSGSPVINLRGEVVGVATFAIQDCENCNFAYAAKLFMSALP